MQMVSPCLRTDLGRVRIAVLFRIGFSIFAWRCSADASAADDIARRPSEASTADEVVRRLELRIDELQEEVQTLRAEQVELRRRLDAFTNESVQPRLNVGTDEGDAPEAPAWAAAMQSSITNNLNTAIQSLKSEMVPTLGNSAAEHDGLETQDDAGNIISVDVGNTDWLKEILFGGSPWILFCDDSKNPKRAQPPAIFEESALQLKEIANFGKLDCWERTAAGKTLAHRFDFPKPPVVFAVANGDPPMVLDVDGLTKPWQLRRKVQPYFSVVVPRIDSPKTFKAACTSRRACLIVGFTTAPMLSEALNVLQPALEEHRVVRAVAVDTSVWKVKLDDKLAATKPKKKDGQKEHAYMVCIARRSGSALSGAQPRAGAFFRLTGDAAPTRENLEVFLDRCASGKNLVTMSAAPQISLRPPEKPKTLYPSSTPSPIPGGKEGKPSAKGKTTQSSGAGAGKQPKSQGTSSSSSVRRPHKARSFSTPGGVRKGGKQDHVGSRESLEEEEPLFSAVEENLEDTEASEEDAAEDDAEEEVEL